MSETLPTPTNDILLRPATPEDIPGIVAFLEEFVRRQLVLPRTPDELQTNYRNFTIACDPKTGDVVGMAALRPHGEDLYEVRSLAVATAWQGKGIGGRLVQRLLRHSQEALPKPARCVFTLTKRPEFFLKLGFRLATRDKFPEKIWADCRLCPNLNCCDETALEIVW